MAGCPTCGAELTHIPQYDRWYCYSCRAYAPRALHECSVCGRSLVYVPEYQGHYCHGCEEYRDAGIQRPCPNCGEEMEYQDEYTRYYCRECGEYAPGDYRPPTHEGPVMTDEEGSEQAGYAPFSREDMDLASKEELMSWCREYGLDDNGMKYELRLRLLEHIRKEGLLLQGERGVPLAAEATGETPPKAPARKAAAEDPPHPEDPRDAALEVRPEVEVIVEDDAHAPSSCPTCGGELTYIPQYGRWYCYRCRAYAPRATGSSTTRLGETERASTPPRPRAATGSGRPTAGLALAFFGLLLFIAHMVLFQAPAIFDFPVYVTSRDVEFILRFLSIVFIALGLMGGILALRPRS